MDFSSTRVPQTTALPPALEAAMHPFTLPARAVRSVAAAPATAVPADACAGVAAAASSAPAAAHLLLFVGAPIHPDATLAALLAREGLRCLSLPGTEQALRAAALARFDAVLIAGELVDGRAARAIETLSATHQCPVVVLAEAADEIDEIVALELGADLYLARPLSPRRLRAHLAALLRRRAAAARPEAGAGGAPSTLQAAGWTLEIGQQRLTRGPRSLRLTLAQTALLRCLLQADGRIVPAGELLAALPRQGQMRAQSLRVYVHRLRQRLRDEGVEGLCLESVRGSGYALNVAVEKAA